MSSNDSTIRYDRGEDGIVVLTLDDPSQSANTMNSAYTDSMRSVVARLEQEKDEIKGVIITSAKKTFFAGGDLNALKLVSKENAQEFSGFLSETKAQLRTIETLGVPVVAAINGAALGGGLEIALAAHHRIIVDDSKAVIGFPEVNLGLLPGAGGVTRTVRMIGIAQALMQVLLQGMKRFKPAEAKELGLVDEIVPSVDDLIPAAKRWIAEKAASGEPIGQPWDTDKKYKIPGGTPSTPSFAANLPAFPANLRKQIKGTNMPAPVRIMAAAVEGAQVDFDHALEIEGRYFVELATGQVAKNMIQAFWFDLNRVGRRPWPSFRHRAVQGQEGRDPRRGDDGGGDRVRQRERRHRGRFKDVSLEAAQRGKQYSVNLVNKAIDRGRSTTEKGEELLALHPPERQARGRGRRRPRDRGGLRGSEDQGAGLEGDRAARRARRAARLQHLDPADHRACRVRHAPR